MFEKKEMRGNNRMRNFVSKMARSSLNPYGVTFQLFNFLFSFVVTSNGQMLLFMLLKNGLCHFTLCLLYVVAIYVLKFMPKHK